MRFRLIAIDLDGTLLDHQHRISPANRAAVDACRAGGAHVLIATGRMYASVRPYAHELGLRGLQITLNGAVLADPVTDRLLTRDRLGRRELDTVVATLVARNCPYAVFGPATIYAEPGMTHIEVLEGYGEPKATRLPRSELLTLSEPVKVLTFAAPGPLDAEMATLLHGVVDVIRTGDQFLEFLPRGVGKGSALVELMHRYGIARDEVLVIGDSENDLSMFAVAGMSIAMGSASEAIKARADAVTLDTAHDGVAVALQQYALSQ
ncbi:MAG TPA: Cof-type HAD-IIB family hydrolase [Roseiflexaceae bacterium]|nr:Cof-type HAD-IIB family hydrolase [Roseiflexaceae bacterium]